ncbi:hypothetical protein [Erwinia phyllosphaerae]|uniref:hypothetical protein n=1 Tax=Erwinia phyllosphaerae TaxID=2853256 RepID=UPI001FEE6847|nr:hypothetical protein [Erwinia phyllosphaerae]MBV4366265.1 hypothetical protein [Erwinia phyllosphaerae]
MASKSNGRFKWLRSPSAAFHLVVLLLLSFFTWKFSSKYISLDSIPWPVIVVLTAAVANSITLYTKLSETKKNAAEDLSRTELRHFNQIVERKRSSTLIVMILQILVVLGVILISMAGKQELISDHIKTLTNIVVSAIACSLYSAIPMLLGIKEVFDFEAVIKNRKKIIKRQSETLKKLAKK